MGLLACLGLLTSCSSAAHAAEAPPLVIDKGGTYTGNWASDDPAIPVIRITTREPVIIEHSTLRGRGALIVADAGAVDLIVRDTRGVGQNPNVAGRAAGRFLQAQEIAHLTIEHCELEGTAGIYVHRLEKTADTAPSLRIVSNLARNIDGRRSDGHDGYLQFNTRTPENGGKTENGFEIVQFLQLDGVVGLENGEIAWNHIINEPGRSRVEDNISLYESSGTAEHPILIHDNCIVGAYTIDPTRTDVRRDGWNEDWSYSGGGIMLGDGPGKLLETASGYLRATHNVVVSTSNYGIAVASGHDTEVSDNQVIASGLLPGGQLAAAQNVGIYVWDAAKGKKRTPPTFFAITVRGNEIGWAAKDKRSRNDWWLPDATISDRNAHTPGPITPATETQAIMQWQSRAVLAGHAPGIQPTKPATQPSVP